MPHSVRPSRKGRSPLVACSALVWSVLANALAAEPACHTQDFAVELAETGPVTLAADICTGVGAADPAVVQILLHGGAYNRSYWQPPVGDLAYSYVSAATARGYVIVNLDRLGYGASTRPDGNALTFELGAQAVSGVVDQIKAGGLGFDARAIVLNGHSMGGIVAEHVAASNASVTALVVSGLPNTPNEAGTDPEEDADGPPGGKPPFIPAAQDTRFSVFQWSEGYMTTAPEARMTLFHAPGTTAEGTAALEAKMRDTIANAELRAVMSGGAPRPDFSGPSVHFLGRHDMIACQGQDCADRFAGTDWHVIVDGAGHSINLSKAAPDFFALTFEWFEGIGLAP